MLMWVDRNGWTRPLTEARRAYVEPRLSPDGKRLAVTIRTDTAYLWIYDLERDAFTRLSSRAEEDAPNWTPDGERISFRSRGEGQDIAWRAADGSGAVEKLTHGAATALRHSWSPDGKVLLFDDRHPTSLFDIWILPLEGERQTRPFLQTPANERPGGFSPDGRWFAYISDESGRFEVYVQPFPGPGGKWQVSTEGGRQPVWARNGREIFYRNGDKMMSVAVETTPLFALSKPELLFEGRYWDSGFEDYDVAPDGERFLMIRAEEEPAPTRIHVVLNWAEELKQQVAPVRR
jgi:Tol biopolymer transport system component